MNEEDDNGEKTEEPSAHRIDEFRKRGEVALSRELNSVIILVGCVFAFSLSIAYIFDEFSILFDWLSQQDVDKVLSGEKFGEFAKHIAVFFLKAIAPVCGVSLILGFFSSVAQIGFLFAPEVLELKLERLNPLSGIKRIFSMKSVIEAIKGILKFTLILSITYYMIKGELGSINGFLHVSPETSFLFAKDLILKIVFAIIGGMFFVAMFDFTYQKFSYRKKLMQTKEQAKKESKERDGNPEIKQRIRTIQREMAQKRMMNDVPDADVIVTNPTHISVALKFDNNSMAAPVVIAKGADFVAMRIREIGKDNDIPIVENVPLARGLYKTVKLRHPIPRTFYKAVAEVLAFVYKMKRRKKALGNGAEARG